MFDDTQRKSLFAIFDCVMDLLYGLYHATISMTNLARLKNVEKYWECYDAILELNKTEEGRHSDVDMRGFSRREYFELLKLRMDEMKAFVDVKKNLEEFSKFASDLNKEGISLDCSKITRCLDGTKMFTCELRHLVKCKRFPAKSDNHEVKYFALSPEELQMITDIIESKCLNSDYAKGVILETASQCETDDLNIESFQEEVWMPALETILATADQLDKGSITFEQVKELLGEDVAGMTSQQVDLQVQILFEILRRAGTDPDNMEKRSEQIQNYLIVQRQEQTAYVLLEIKEKLDLKGNFDAIKKPLTVGGCLSSITKGTIKAASYIESITPEQLSSLKFFQAGDLLVWVKQHMKDLGEVKVMSDLAMISAGETPMEVDRVSCFLSAVMGFSPIIFDLPEDAGLKSLLKACKQVWENIDRDESLVKKWIRLSLTKCLSYKSLLMYFKEDMDRDSPIAMCIPSKRGRGRCAYVLVEYLIGKQNDILHQCRDHIKPKPSFSLVDASKVTKRDIISISKKKDLMSLIQANHQYETVAEDSGPTHKIIYDFGLLEKKVVEKFIFRKSEIECQTVPLMQYPQDVGLSKDSDKVERNIKQLPLPIRMCHDIDTFVESVRTANICEAVRTMTIVIQFLAKLGAEGEQTICDYSERELLLPPEETEMIPRSALISHCLALYERLSWHRSKRLIQNGQNPFENVLECAKNIEDEELIENLTEEMKGMNIERLQLELNAVMMIGPEMKPDWSLGSIVLLNYLDCKHDGIDNSWCERLPEEILYKHAAHVFELSMKLVDNK